MLKRNPGKKTIALLGMIIILISGGVYVSRHYKSWIIRYHLRSTLTNLTDSLYTLNFDNLTADTANGNIYVKNIHIAADTGRINIIPTAKLPVVMIDAAIKELTIRKAGISDSAETKNISGDTIVIRHPRITMYILKPLQKNTQLEIETRRVFHEILKKLSRVKIGYLMTDSIYVQAVNFRTKEKSFDLLNGNIELRDVLIDRAGGEDTLRTLFTRNASFKVDSFVTYQNDRREIIVQNIGFDGWLRSLAFGKIIVNNFAGSDEKPRPLLDVSNFWLRGMNTTAIIKNKDIAVDSIGCDEVRIYEPKDIKLAELWSGREHLPAPADTVSGFQNAYSIHLKSLLLDNIKFIPAESGKFDLGKVRFQLHNIAAGRLSSLRSHPSRHTGEADLEIAYLRMMSRDGQYHFSLRNISANSLQKSLLIENISLLPVLTEKEFALHFPFQKDRYQVSMSNIQLNGIEMDNLFRRSLIANELTIGNTMVRIYRDMNKPADTVNKTGNYPSQLLQKVNLPISIKTGELPLVSVEYKEKRKKNGGTGTIRFENTDLHISNITNIPSEISNNGVLRVNFSSDIQGSIALKGNLSFFLNGNKGDFRMTGTIGGFNAPSLNNISVPMALIRVKTGYMEGIEFDFEGDDFGAGGEMVMKYRNLKIEVLKQKNKNADTLKKRGLITFIANMAISDDNPGNGTLRRVNPGRRRNPRKSFFNLIWKTLFDGMKETVGIS